MMTLDRYERAELAAINDADRRRVRLGWVSVQAAAMVVGVMLVALALGLAGRC